MNTQTLANNQSDAAEQVATFLGWFSIGLGLAEILAPKELARFIGVRGNETLMRAYGARELAAGAGILMSGPRPAAWVWSRVAGDMLDLATMASAFQAESTDSRRLTAATAAVAGVTAMDIWCAQQLSSGTGASSDIYVQKSVTVNKAPEECYRFWRNLENLPRFMDHLQSVEMTDGNRSHWVTKAPMGRRVEWDAEMTTDSPNECIAWRSLENADIDNSGTVHFQRATGNRGTVVRVQLRYSPPGGKAGAMFAKLFNQEPGQQVIDDLHHFKQIIETGEVPTTEGQPSGRRPLLNW